MEVEYMEKTVCELFAGVGGFRLGLERASSEWKTVWFSQWEPGKKNQWAHNCYVKHWQDIDENTGIDIAKVDKNNIPNHNLLVGGFPCQDYSVARPLPGSKGIIGKKGVLWWQIKDTLEIKKAPFALFENVDRLLKSPANQRGRDFGVILSCLSSLGYSAEWRVVNAADYGAGQRRRRVFIFAYKDDTKYSEEMSKLNPDDIIMSKGFFAKSFPVEQTISISTTSIDYTDIPKVSDKFEYLFKNAGYMKNGKLYTSNVMPIFEEAIKLKIIIEPNVDEKYFLGDNLEKWKYLKGSKRISRTSKNGHDYIFSEGAISFPDNLDLPARTILTSESSLNRSTHVISDPKSGKYRLLTPIEIERIQGFDDNWTDTGMPERFRYFCMGNALVVQMITRMGKVLNEIFENE